MAGHPGTYLQPSACPFIYMRLYSGSFAMKAALFGMGVCCMSRRQKDPLRPLGEEERNELTGLSRSRSAPAQVIRARTLLAVAAGRSYTEAALLAGRHTGDTIRDWVSRFHREDMAAVIPRHGGGPPHKR
jgi:Helix-turn-helix domain